MPSMRWSTGTAVLLLCGAESCELLLMALIHYTLSQQECVTLRPAANRSAFGNPTEPQHPGLGHRLYCAVSHKPQVMMGTCSKLACVQRYITVSPFMQLPILADQIILSSNYLFLTLDKEGWKQVWGRRGKLSLACGMTGFSVSFLWETILLQNFTYMQKLTVSEIQLAQWILF